MFHVEQLMKITKLYLFIFVFVSFGCKKPLPDPQASDYIYQELKQELAAAESQLAEKQGQMKELKDKLTQSDIQSSELKMIRVKIDFAQRSIRKQEQRVRFWKARLLSREELVRRQYLTAFNKGEEWNNSDEVERYKKGKLMFRTRVPANKSEKSTAEGPKEPKAH
jgi:hypothetical protein